MLLAHDGLHTIGREERDWIKADLTADVRRVCRDRLARLAKRNQVVVAKVDPSEEDITEVGQWAALRRSLQAHFRIAAQKGALQWRKTAGCAAARCAAVPAHRVRGVWGGVGQ